MKGRFWAWATLVAGLGSIALFVAFAMLPEAQAAGGCLPAGSVVQFELARNAAELARIFGAPGSACHNLAIAAMDAVNNLDVGAFIPTYTAFCIAAALMLADGGLRPLSVLAIVAALVALGGDYLETVTLLKITHALEGPDALLASSQAGAWIKFGALGAHALFCAGLCVTAGARRPILGVLLLGPALGVAAAAYDHLALANIMNLAFALAWIALLIAALASALRKRAAP